MNKNMNIKTVTTAIVFGVMVSLGTYFFIPQPRDAHAQSCDESYIINRILYCIDGSTISGSNFSTYCNG